MFTVDAAKSIIFATKNHLAQNFAVNLGYVLARANLFTFYMLTLLVLAGGSWCG